MVAKPSCSQERRIGTSEDNEADPGTKCLERDRIKKCCDEDGDVVHRARAGEQLPGVSDTEVIMGEDLMEGQSWTMGVVLLVTVGVILPSCARAVFDPDLPTGNVHETREPAIAKQRSCTSRRAMQDDDLDHLNVTERDVDSLMVFWRSAEAADGVEHVEFVWGSWYSSCGTLQARMRTRPTFALFSCCLEFFDWVTGGDDYWYEVFNPSSGGTIASTLRPSAQSGPERMAT